MPVQMRRYKKGSIIWMENSKAMPYFFIVQSGQLKQFLKLMDSEDVTLLNKGDTFGLIGCLTGHNYLDRMIAVEDSVVIMIKNQELIPFLAKKPEIFMRIVSDYSNRLRKINNKLFALCSRSLRDNLPDHFLEIAAFYKSHQQEMNAQYALKGYLKYGQNPATKKQIEGELAMRESAGTGAITYPERHGHHAIYKPGQIVFLEQEKGDEFYFIEQGKVKICHIDKENEFVIAILKAGEFFGEMAILNQEERNASAVAFEDTRLLVLNRTTFMNQLGVEILKNVFTSLSRRMWYSFRRSINLSYHNPVLRLYDCLDFIIESRGGKKKESSYAFDITFQDLRAMTNTLILDDHKIREFLSDENIKINYGAMTISNLSKFYDMLKLYRGRERSM